MALVLVKKNPQQENSIHHIIDNIYLGNCDSRLFIAENNIKRIIEIGEEDELLSYPAIENKNNEKLEIFSVKISDNRNTKIDDYFNDVWEFIKKDNNNVLIHCKMGTSRSVTFVISYLIKYKKMSVEESIKFIESKRNDYIYTSPNFGFRKILKKLSEKLRE